MANIFKGNGRWHIAGWIVLIPFELFLVSYYTDYHVDLPVGIWHYILTISLFYAHAWFIQHDYVSIKKSLLAVTVTVVLLQGTVYVLLNIWMFELLYYAGIHVRWSMSPNWLVALAIWRAILFMSMSTGFWLLESKIKSIKGTNDPEKPQPPEQVYIKEAADPDHMYINPGVKGKVIKVGYNDIQYVEGLKNYILIYTNETRHTTCLTLKEMQNILPPERFIRIHKSFIVNIDRIKSYEGDMVLLNQGPALPVGGGYKYSFLEHIGHLIVKREKTAL
ncbi:MAG TPA: LytTR family DNA-binding domain-containing protein [Sphingobacteriaceae bacterium]